MRKFNFLVLLLIVAACNAPQEVSVEQQANELHKRILTLDTHCDTPLNLGDEGYDIGKRNNFDSSRTRVDFVRMQEGEMDAMFFAVFIGQGKRDSLGLSGAKNRAIRITDMLDSVLDRYSEMAELAITAGDAYTIEKKNKRAIYYGMENGYPIGKDISLIDYFYERGIRYITLSHSWNNDICDSSTDTVAEHNGLSKFGEQVVGRMNQKGMLVDVSHISDSAFYDVINLSKTPVIASHSCARALCDHPRNMNDEMLKKLAENGGVIQLCILSSYLVEPPKDAKRDSAFAVLREKYKSYGSMSEEEKKEARKEWRATQEKYPEPLATVADAIDHIDHIVKLIGIDYVGIGTDFDGGGGLSDCKDVSEIKNITLELLKRGYSEEDIEKIWGGNFMRVFRQVEEYSSKM